MIMDAKRVRKTELFIVGIRRLGCDSIKILSSSKRAGVAVAEPQVWAPASKSPAGKGTYVLSRNRGPALILGICGQVASILRLRAREGELGPHRRQLANRAAQRLDLVMRVVSVHFRRCMTDKLLSDFDRHSCVRYGCS